MATETNPAADLLDSTPNRGYATVGQVNIVSNHIRRAYLFGEDLNAAADFAAEVGSEVENSNHCSVEDAWSTYSVELAPLALPEAEDFDFDPMVLLGLTA